MSQKFDHTIILTKILSILSNLKLAFYFLLHQSFFQYSSSTFEELQYLDSHSNFRRKCEISDVGSNECAVCLCRIEEGTDEIAELKYCSHVFHSVCIDRWVGYGHWTCPLCRNHINFPRIDAHDQLHEQEQVLLVFNFREVRSSSTGDSWWLR